MDMKMIILLILAILLALVITLLVGTLVNMFSKHDRPIRQPKINEETLVVTRRPIPEKTRKVKIVKVKEEKEIEPEIEAEYDYDRMIQIYEENERKLENRHYALRRNQKEAEVILAEERRKNKDQEIVKVQPVVVTEPEVEYVTYTKIKFYRSDRELIYVVPKNTYLIEGQKIKVRIDEDTVRTAKVIKGNYTREKYKGYEYKTIEIVK